MDLLAFVEEKINHYAKMMLDHQDKADDLSMGELSFYTSLRRVLKGNASTQDAGMMDAINDVLQEKGLVGKGTSFYK